MAAKDKVTQPSNNDNLTVEKDTIFSEAVPFWSLTNLDDSKIWYGLIGIRLFQAFFLTKSMTHPDEVW